MTHVCLVRHPATIQPLKTQPGSLSYVRSVVYLSFLEPAAAFRKQVDVLFWRADRNILRSQSRTLLCQELLSSAQGKGEWVGLLQSAGGCFRYAYAGKTKGSLRLPAGNR